MGHSIVWVAYPSQLCQDVVGHDHHAHANVGLVVVVIRVYGVERCLWAGGRVGLLRRRM